MNPWNTRILVIDDNPAIHEDFRKILAADQPSGAKSHQAEEILFGESNGPDLEATFEVNSAYQGQEGLEMLQQSLVEARPYALAFVDVRMPPGWDGVETISRLWKAYPLLQAVICTAYSDYSWHDISRRIGPSDNLVILKKPYENIEVLQLAHALTRKWCLTVEVTRRLGDLDAQVSRRTQELQATQHRLLGEVALREQAEQELRFSEERFARAFQASPVPMAVVDPKAGRLVDANDSFLELGGLTLGALHGATAHPLDLRLRNAEQPTTLSDLARATPVRDVQCVIRNRDGSRHDIVLSTVGFTVRGRPQLLLILQRRSTHAPSGGAHEPNTVEPRP